MREQCHPVAMASDDEVGDGDDDDDGIFDECARGLEADGYALLSLSALPSHGRRRPRGVCEGCVATDVARAFDTARRALDAVHRTGDHSQAIAAAGPSPPLIDPSTDSGGWTGYHPAASGHGRYNRNREGFVFSDGGTFDAAMTSGGADDGGTDGGGSGASDDDFRAGMGRLFRAMHDDAAGGVLGAIERRLGLPRSYFRRELGPTETSSQWHVKRYVVDDAVQDRDASHPNPEDDAAIGERDDRRGGDDVASAPGGGKSRREAAEMLLPVHTDPSLISVIVHDRAGTNAGGMGLEVFHPDPAGGGAGGSWREISRHGHEIAVIFVGSVLSHLTGGRIYSAARHRVVNRDTSSHSSYIREADGVGAERMAATLFVRPNGDAVMRRLPSRHLQCNDGAMIEKKEKNPMTFRVWNARVAKNYVKRKPKQVSTGTSNDFG